MADVVVRVVENRAVVQVPGSEALLALASVATAANADRAEAALAEIEDIASGAPDAPSILNKLNREEVQTWAGGGDKVALDFTIDDQGSDLTASILRVAVTGDTDSSLDIQKRGHIYSTGTVLKFGYQDAPGDGGNIQISASDPIMRAVCFGSGHGVVDCVAIGGTPGSPTFIPNGQQILALAARSWNGAGVTTCFDLTAGATENHAPGSFGTGWNLWSTLNGTDDLFRNLEATGTGVLNAYGPIANLTTVRTGVNFIGFLSSPTIGAGVDAGTLRHFLATDPSLGAGASISSTHTGFEVADFSGAGNQLGIRSNMAAGSNKWALFLGGGAQSWTAGNFGIGTSSPAVPLDVVGAIRSTTTIRAGSYTVATVPSASAAGPGAMIYVSDETGGAVPAFSDNTAWRRVTDRTVIA